LDSNYSAITAIVAIAALPAPYSQSLLAHFLPLHCLQKAYHPAQVSEICFAGLSKTIEEQ